MDVYLILKFAAALAPAPLLLALFAVLDVFRLMSLREIALLLLFGMLAGLMAFPVSGGLLDTLPLGFSSYSRFVAPWFEELFKGAFVVGLFAANRIGFKLDAAISGFAIGVGFALVENIFYLMSFPQFDIGVWMVRGFGTAVMHGGVTAIFAVVSHELMESHTRKRAGHWRMDPIRFAPGFLLGVALHLAFNQLPDYPLLAMLASLLLVPITLFLVFRFGESESRDWLSADSEAHLARLESLKLQGFAGEEAARIREALERRAHGRVPLELVRDYVELHTELVLRAEALLKARATGDTPPIDSADKEALGRLDQLERSLGKSVLAALKPSLPFSRNDLWELREFRQAVRAS
jgi:RsiW-degrading membrane proteinase PrsW (M82 family)